MITNIYGIKQFQTHLPQISNSIKDLGGHYLVTQRNTPIFVTIPFEEYQELQEILLEMNSPQLKRSIRKARKEFKEGKSVSLEDFLKDE